MGVRERGKDGSCWSWIVVRYGKTIGLDSMLLSAGGDLLTVLWFIEICDACSEVFSIRALWKKELKNNKMPNLTTKHDIKKNGEKE